MGGTEGARWIACVLDGVHVFVFFKHDSSVAKPVTSVLVIVFIQPKDAIASMPGLGQLCTLAAQCLQPLPALFRAASQLSIYRAALGLSMLPSTSMSSHILFMTGSYLTNPHRGPAFPSRVLFVPVCSVPLKQSTFFAHWLPLAVPSQLDA